MPKDKVKLVITPGIIVSCLNCHQQLGTAVETQEAAERLARIHFALGCNKPHDGHTMAFTPTQLVRLKK